jgi:hypothetical protein
MGLGSTTTYHDSKVKEINMLGQSPPPPLGFGHPLVLTSLLTYTIGIPSISTMREETGGDGTVDSWETIRRERACPELHWNVQRLERKISEDPIRANWARTARAHL